MSYTGLVLRSSHDICLRTIELSISVVAVTPKTQTLTVRPLLPWDATTPENGSHSRSVCKLTQSRVFGGVGALRMRGDPR